MPGWASLDNRKNGMLSLTFSLAESGIAAVISVSIIPGATAFTVICLEASSLARDFVIPITPALLAE